MLIDRRQFLGLAGAGMAAGMAAGLAAACEAGAGAGGDDTPDALARPALLAALGTETVRAIGARYRAMVAAERDPEALRAAILDARPWAARRRAAAPPSVAALVRSDFARGRTVAVDGWILSATEARQCALYSLLPA
jgi:hypothetical protein